MHRLATLLMSTIPMRSIAAHESGETETGLPRHLILTRTNTPHLRKHLPECLRSVPGEAVDRAGQSLKRSVFRLHLGQGDDLTAVSSPDRRYFALVPAGSTFSCIKESLMMSSLRSMLRSRHNPPQR